ncbi:MAG: GNAT family N-acetyltransferase [Anaerolineae bacterium]|nr:GNAT family N-acetyltransferase [Anaerolineae bacterium]
MKLRVEGPLTGQSHVCEPILRALPDWFGLEASTQAYIKQTDLLPTFVAVTEESTVGFLTVKQHSAAAAEILVMCVLPQYHRQGIGRALVEDAEDYMRRTGISFLQVKTLSARHPDPNYARTRAFYKAVGFVELEEFTEIWEAGSPCLQMIKYLL